MFYFCSFDLYNMSYRFILLLYLIILFQNTHVPLRAMMTSSAMWAIIVAHSCYNFGNYTLMTKLPAFMKEFLHFDIKSVRIFNFL